MRATRVNAGLAESNGRLLLGIWRDSLHVTCGLTASTPGSAPGPTLGNEYGKTLPFTQVSRYQKGKTNLDYTEARDSEWQWHQLEHMQVCTSLQTDNHTSTPPLSFLQARCLSAAQPTASKHWRLKAAYNKSITYRSTKVWGSRRALNSHDRSTVAGVVNKLDRRRRWRRVWLTLWIRNRLAFAKFSNFKVWD